MRITNKMMTNNMMHNINRNKNNLSVLDEQYSSGKKIQRPSQDPIIAVRALKLRTNLSELNQYYKKNIPDAKSWMDVTESALANINEALTKINRDCVQGTNDPLSVTNRTSIIENLNEYKKQIYQEGNSNYAGRYVFSGYKTDTSLIFNDDTTNLEYNITEKFAGVDMEAITKVTGAYSLNQYSATNPASNDFSAAPNLIEVHRLRLSYDNLEDKSMGDISYTKVAADGTKTNGVVTSSNIQTISVTNPLAYVPSSGKINYIPETGELIMADDVYETLRLAEDIEVTYDKNKFKEGDLRPEHYFDCKLADTDKPELGEITYTKADQQIQYEINFNQKLTINTQGSDAIQPEIGRDIEEILQTVQDVTSTEEKIKQVKKMLAENGTTPGQAASLQELLEQLNTELVLKNKILHDKFEKGITGNLEQQETLNVANAELGSRYVRLELTEDRLSSQQVNFSDLLSNNEDADEVETYIKLSSAENIYNASLSAASKVVKNTLLDFL
jgi:flagellar hook-associated protein 3 FlgL